MFELDSEKLLELLKNKNCSLSEYMLQQEIKESGQPRTWVLNKMNERLLVMESSARESCEQPIYSISGLTGGDAYRYSSYLKAGHSLLGRTASQAAAMALSCSEVNASMRRVVACPTAGSCGIVPAALLSVANQAGKSREELLLALMAASGVGMLIDAHATLSGAEGGCQAECGSAAAMAAAGVTELLSGSPAQALHAAAMALKNVMGLVCDPVAGLVEIPCIKRNASGVMNALLCADLALAGVESRIPFGEVVDAMYHVGKAMSPSLRETALGGLAATPTAQRMKIQASEVY